MNPWRYWCRSFSRGRSGHGSVRPYRTPLCILKPTQNDVNSMKHNKCHLKVKKNRIIKDNRYFPLCFSHFLFHLCSVTVCLSVDWFLSVICLDAFKHHFNMVFLEEFYALVVFFLLNGEFSCQQKKKVIKKEAFSIKELWINNIWSYSCP